MAWMNLLASFCGGIFLINAVPHTIAGVMGQRFPSPFAQAASEGYSSSTVNVLWGFVNLAIGYVLAWRLGAVDPRDTASMLALCAGALPMALFSSRYFGRFNGGNPPFP